jgi:uncharacterized protein (TIGR02302 family)
MIRLFSINKTNLLLSLKRYFTFGIISLERITTSSYRLFYWILLFISIWLFQLLPIISAFASFVAFFVFISGAAYFLLKDFKKFKLPDKNEVNRRLELASNLKHRPLNLHNDKLANPEKIKTKELWKKRERLYWKILPELRFPAPKPFFTEKDPYAVRIAILILFIVGFIISGHDWQNRIKNGLYPFSFNNQTENFAGLTIWLTPPEYTNTEQIILQGQGKRKETLNIAEDSSIKIRVTDGIGHPVLYMDEKKTPLKHLGHGTYGLETKITATSQIQIKQLFVPRAKIPINIIKDTPPKISLNKDIAALEKGQLQLFLSVEDDYGVKDLHMKMTLDPMVESKPLGKSFSDVRAVMSAPNTRQELQPVYDLAWHPWAGLPVILYVEVTDHIGQIGSLAPIKTILPERVFRHPVSSKLIENRKTLAWDPQGYANEASANLTDILIQPDKYQHNPVVFLSLRSMASRLYYNNSTPSVAAVIEQLWDTALSIEEGDISIASRNLRKALQDLEQALSNPDASEFEIANKMDSVRQALAAYFQEMAKEMLKRQAENGNIPNTPMNSLSQMFTPEDLLSFLDQLQSEAFSGDFDSAREMLSQLQQMMDVLDPSMSASMPMDMQFMMEGVSELQQLIEKQEKLLSQTREQSLAMNPPTPSYGEAVPFDEELLKEWGLQNVPPLPFIPPAIENSPESGSAINTEDNKVEQDALRYILGKLMLEAESQLGEIPENMDKAEKEMRLSATQLSQNRPDLSIPHQEKALEYLQESMEQMSQQLKQRLSSMMLFSFGGGSQMDPLGRPYGEGNKPDWWPGSKVKIPEEAERKKVQEILKILRQRAGDRDRPDYELEYYNRLLRQF